MFRLKRLVIMHTLNVSSAVAGTVIDSMERSGVNEESVTLLEYVVAAGAAYADYRDRQAEERRTAG